MRIDRVHTTTTTVQSLLICAMSIRKSHGVVWRSLAWSSVLFAPGKLSFCCAGYGLTGLPLVLKTAAVAALFAVPAH